jgi:hypothetical protein
MDKETQVTDYTVLVTVAEEIVEILHKHGIRRREVVTILEIATERLDSQPVQEAKAYPNSR